MEGHVGSMPRPHCARWGHGMESERGGTNVSKKKNISHFATQDWMISTQAKA